jgi:hypothetical protein
LPKVLMLYNPPVDENGKPWKPADLAPLIDRAIWTPEPGDAGREQYAREMLAVNDAIEFHMYVLQHGGHLALPRYPNNNQILTRRGEAENLLKTYPAIALHDAKTGDVILKNEKQDYFVANTAHPKWRSRFIEHVQEVLARADFYTRLWVDDCGTESRFNYTGRKVVKEYPTRELYFDHTCGWLTYLRDQVALANGLRFGANLQAPPDQLEDWKRAAGILLTSGGDVLVEWGWLNHDGEFERSAWDNTLNKGDYATRYGGQFNTVVQRDPRPLKDKSSRAYQEFMFALNSQMLISNGQDGMRVDNDYSRYVHVPEIRQIDLDLGKPLGFYRQVGDHYERDFEKHTIKVYPETQTFEWFDPPVVIPPVPELQTFGITVTFDVAAENAAQVKALLDSMQIKLIMPDSDKGMK